MEIFDTLYIYFQYPIVVKALVAGVLIAFCSSLLGVSLVLKRYSFIGDGLSHVAFAALSIATLTSISNNMLIVLPITILAAVLMLRTGQNSRINGDAVVAMISVGCLAVGYMLMNIFSGSSNVSGDVCSTLFGSTSLLTLSTFDMWICIIMSMVVLIFFLLFYHKIFSVTFDENFAKATGIRSGAYNMLMAVITAVIIVLAMNLVGSLLISALIIFPALSAMRVYKNFMSVIVCSGIVSVVGAVLGLCISLIAATPVGATIVSVYIVIFIIFMLIGMVKEGIRW